MDNLINRQMENIEKAYESIPIGGKLEFSKSAIESIHQILRELKKYKDLEEQGLLIKLPCKIGDAVNANVTRPYNGNKAVFSGKITDIQTIIRVENCFDRHIDFLLSDFEKTLFLAQEENELKLIKGEQ